MKNLIAIRRVMLAVGIVLCTSSLCCANFVTGFEAPDYTASSAGTLLTGQQSWELPAGSTDYNVYTYAGNTLGLVSNPAGGAQFIGGAAAANSVFARAQLMGLDYSGAQPYVFSYDFNGDYQGAAGQAANNLGSFSLQPSGTTQSYIALKPWINQADTTQGYQAQYNVYDAAGAALNGQMPYTAPLNVLATNRWYHEEVAVDFNTHQILSVSLTDLTTSDKQTVAPNGWYLQGGAASALPLPTGVRVFTGGNPGNVMGWDNVSAAPVPEPSTLCLLGIGLAGLLIAVRRGR